MLKQFTTLIIEERERQNITPKMMAKHLNVSRQYYNRIEQGELTLKYLILICEYLNLSIKLIPKRYL